MGRLSIIISDETEKRLRKIVEAGRGKMSKFIEEAINEKIDRILAERKKKLGEKKNPK